MSVFRTSGSDWETRRYSTTNLSSDLRKYVGTCEVRERRSVVDACVEWEQNTVIFFSSTSPGLPRHHSADPFGRFDFYAEKYRHLLRRHRE